MTDPVHAFASAVIASALRGCVAIMLTVGGGLVAASTMTSAERLGHERQIAADFKADKARCDKLGVEKAACLDKARTSHRVAQAELAYNDSGSQIDAGRLAVARSDADYAFAKERCESRKPVDREYCIRQAKAEHARPTPAGH